MNSKFLQHFGPWILAMAFLALMLPSLNKSRLMEVDELTHASIARELADSGHWMPLTLHGEPWPLKPPLLFWVSALAARVSGDPMQSWPYRIGCCLGAALCVAALARLGIMAGGLGAGMFAALLFALQGDLLFHARFFTMDSAALASLLWSLVFICRGRPALAGAALALGVWIKSFYVLAFLPPLLFAAFAARDLSPFRRSALWLLGMAALSVTLWFSFYAWVYGDWFVNWELKSDLMQRAVAGGINERSGSNFRYFSWWGGMAAGALVPLALAAPLGLLRSRGPVAAFALAFPLYWMALLSAIQSQVINYLMPLEAALCLAWALLIWQPKNSKAWLICMALAWVSWRVLRPEGESRIVFGFSALAALALILSGDENPRFGLQGALVLLMGLAVLLPLSVKGWKFVRHPDDPSRELAEILLQNPARKDGETLNLLGENTQAIGFYSRYNVRPLASLPKKRPPEATLAKTKDGWAFYPPLK